MHKPEQLTPGSMGRPDTPGATASMTITDTVTGTHMFTVKGYSLLLGRGVGESVASEKFQAGGHEWIVQFYPDGYNEELNNAEYVALSLTLASEATNLWALYNFTMLDQTGRGQDRSMGRSVQRGPCKFESQNFRRGKPRFIKRSELSNSGLLVNDMLIIRCEVSVVVTRTSHEDGAPSVRVPPSRLGQDLGALLASGEDADVTFLVKDERVEAHKMILSARSPVFKAMLHSPMSKGTEGGVKIEAMEPVVFQALLHFIYTDEAPSVLRDESSTASISTTQLLLAAADCYGLERLRLLCEQRLCEGMSVETAANTLVIADMHQAARLKEICLDYIANNLSQVMSTESFRELAKLSPSLSSEVLKAAAGIIASERKSPLDGTDADGRRVRRRVQR